MTKQLMGIIVGIFFISSQSYAGTLGDVTGDGTVGVTEAVYALQVSSGLRIPLSINSEIIISSFIVEIQNGAGLHEILTIPSDKTFILTDIWGTTGNNSIVYEDETKKAFLTGNASASQVVDFALHLTSGIPFSPGTTIFISSISGHIHLTISGYYIQNTVAQ
jgi:hypothetical protein